MLLANIILLIAACFNAADSCKVDEYTNVYCEDQQARLDNYAALLEKSPGTRAYILVYGGRKDRFGNDPRRHEAQMRGAAIKDYLVNTRGIKGERIVTIDGGYRETWTVELYVCSPDAPTPKATPTLSAKQIRFRTRKPKHEEYIVFCG
jgi:hypothetical protein